MDWTYRLRLRHLQVLISLASTGNLSKSAAALNTTQPALSKWLKELEEDVGVALFERHARGLRPTSYGEALIEHARRIEAHLDSARDDLHALRVGGSGLVTIGTSGVSAADTVPLAVSVLLERMPNMQVRLIESTMNELVPQLGRGELDIVVGRSERRYDVPHLCIETLYTETIDFVARPDHPLAQKQSLDWEDVLAYTWIVWPKNTPVRIALDNALADAGHALPDHCIESNSALFNLTLLNNSSLLGVASHRAASRFEQLNAIRILPMRLNGIGSVSIYWLKESENRPAIVMALDAMRSFADSRTSGWTAPAEDHPASES